MPPLNATGSGLFAKFEDRRSIWQPPERSELKIDSPNLAEEQKDN